MGAIILTQSGFASNPGANYTAITPTEGDSTQIRQAGNSSSPLLIAFERSGTTSGAARIRSSEMHDNVKGYHVISNDNPTFNALPAGLIQPMKPQDTPIIEVTGGTAEYDGVMWTTYYDGATSGSASLSSWSDIASRVKDIVTVQNVLTTASAVGNYASAPINTTDALLRANDSYAILGYMVDTPVTCVGIKGADTSNYLIGAPGSTDTNQTANYFVNLSNKINKPCIPVINSSNASNTFATCSDVATSVTFNYTLVMALLG